MVLVSVTRSSCIKMKILLLLFLLSMVYAQDDRLRFTINNYKLYAKNNPEFSEWIERLENMDENGTDKEKAQLLREFEEYDRKRLQMDEKITIRIDDIDSLLPDRRLSQVCVNEYLNQRNALFKAKKLSIDEKQRIVNENSAKCTKKDTTTTRRPKTTKETWPDTTDDYESEEETTTKKIKMTTRPRRRRRTTTTTTIDPDDEDYIY